MNIVPLLFEIKRGCPKDRGDENRLALKNRADTSVCPYGNGKTNRNEL